MHIKLTSCLIALVATVVSAAPSAHIARQGQVQRRDDYSLWLGVCIDPNIINCVITGFEVDQCANFADSKYGHGSYKDSISSYAVPPGYKCTLFVNLDCSGSSEEANWYKQDIRDENKSNDSFSSYRCTSDWQYEHPLNN
ncbi:hypothetical protein C8R43DRAFT_1134340 [Mycena crocata]|nr:hypothetical protein C8R43DRAFT_1134340 [Mycena crocata]